MAALALTACSSATAPLEPARLEVVHLTPQVGRLRIVQGDEALPVAGANGDSLVFNEVSPLLVLNPGTTRFTGLDETQRRLFSRSLILASGRRYSLRLLPGDTTAPEAPSINAVLVPVDDAVPAASAGIRLMHAAVGVEPVDVTYRLVDPQPLPATKRQEAPDEAELVTLASALRYGAVIGPVPNPAVGSGSPPTLVVPGEAVIAVRQADSQILLRTTRVVVAAGTVTEVALTGTPGALGLLVWQRPADSQPTVP